VKYILVEQEPVLNPGLQRSSAGLFQEGITYKVMEL